MLNPRIAVGALHLNMYGRIHDPGMRSYPPRTQQGIDVGPRATVAARSLHELRPISHQPMGGDGVSTPRAGRYRPEVSLFLSRVVQFADV